VDHEPKYRAESGDILLSVQLTLAGEEPTLEAVAPLPDRATPSAGERSSRMGHPSVLARGVAPVELALVDAGTGAGTPRALRRDLRTEVSSGYAAGEGPSIVGLLVEPCAEMRSSGDDEQAEDLLRAVVEVIPFLVRARDRVYRTGPDELALLMPGTGDGGKEAALRRLLEHVPKAIAERRLGEVRLIPRRISTQELQETG
jgi:GGDEF domain-containing protein